MSTDRILYLSGPMTGYPEWNFPAFDQARTFLRERGFAVLCPAESDRELGFDEKAGIAAWTPEYREEAARRDARMISHADAVAVLRGFTRSNGARVELMLARWIGLPVVAAFAPDYELTSSVDEWLRFDRLDDDLREFEGIRVRKRREDEISPETAKEDPIRVALSLVGIGDPMHDDDPLGGVDPKPKVSRRRAMLDEAANLVDGDRNASYGDPSQDFRRTASLWSTYLDGKTELDPHDVAAMMALLKLSRLRWSPEKRDSWVDLAGYAACGLSTVPEDWEK